MVEINWTDLAIKDLNDIGEYIAKDSERYAEITIENLFSLPDILEKSPKIGRKVPEINRDDIRELISGNYRVIYRLVSETRIDILTVHHSKRLFSNNPVSKKLK
jgi:toxin ParE1/3/4